MTDYASAAFAPPPDSPQNPEFYRRALDEWPSPLLVVNEQGQVVYGNRALEALGGWDRATGLGTSVLDHVHPEDAERLAEAFFELAAATEASSFETGTPWASIHFRLVSANGQPIPVQVTGSGGPNDPAVGGILYDVRPAHEQDILRRGLTGLAEGEPIDEILGLIADMIALPPLDLDAAVVEPHGTGTYRIVGATNPDLHEILSRASDPMPWSTPARTPRRTIVSQFPGGIGEDLFAAGYRDFWNVSPEVTAETLPYSIVACSPTIHRPASGPIDRLSRANELAGVVLLRARADALLEHSATHDRLTELPNREGFYRRGAQALADASGPSAALLFVDLDGFKQVNDEHGHAAGDRVLEATASRLRAVTRSVDLVARLGGDEFVILLGTRADRPADRARVQAIADRTLEQVARDINIGEASAAVSASIGVVIAPSSSPLEQLLAKADAAMYEAKRAGGNQAHIVETS